MPISTHNVFELCRQALGVSQEGLGRMVGVSRRTAQRWTSHGTPSSALIDLARVVHPRNPALAGEIVATLGTTLEAAGIVAPAPPPPPAATPPPVANGTVDAVVCAAAEAMEMMPNEVRPGLYAAFARAQEIGLSVDFIERALRLKLAAAPEPSPVEPQDTPAPKRKVAGRGFQR
jgi:hypothetical protein